MPTVRFQLRRDTAANWASVNPTLGPGEPAIETDTRKVKYGDGSMVWNALPYSLSASLTAVSALTPAADRFIYFTSGTAASLGTVTAFARSIMDDADAATMRGTLGLGTMATQNASAVAITGGSALGLSSAQVTAPSSAAISYLDSIAGQFAITRFRTGTSNRWDFGKENVAESGANAGSDFVIRSFDDSGAFLRTDLRVTRSSGAWSFGGIVRPIADNSISLGAASLRWSVVYAGTGTINTSDQRHKTWRGGLTDAELRAGKRIIADLGFYQWKDAIKAKGADGARLHFGVRAQRAFVILESEGLDWRRYAWCCYDEWDAMKAIRGSDGKIVQPGRRAGNRYGVRTDQLNMFLIAVQEARIARLEQLASVE